MKLNVTVRTNGSYFFGLLFCPFSKHIYITCIFPLSTLLHYVWDLEFHLHFHVLSLDSLLEIQPLGHSYVFLLSALYPRCKKYNEPYIYIIYIYLSISISLFLYLFYIYIYLYHLYLYCLHLYISYIYISSIIYVYLSITMSASTYLCINVSIYMNIDKKIPRTLRYLALAFSEGSNVLCSVFALNVFVIWLLAYVHLHWVPATSNTLSSLRARTVLFGL